MYTTVNEKIEIIVSPKALEQIKLMCKEVPRLEWSAVLFYSIDGTFGIEGI